MWCGTNGPAAAQPSSTTRSPASAPAAAAGAASVAVALTPEASDARSTVVARERCSAISRQSPPGAHDRVAVGT